MLGLRNGIHLPEDLAELGHVLPLSSHVHRPRVSDGSEWRHEIGAVRRDIGDDHRCPVNEHPIKVALVWIVLRDARL